MSARIEFRRDVLNKIGAGVVIVDPRTRLIEWANPTAAHLFGASVDAVVGQPCHCFLCPGEAGVCPVLDHDQDADNTELSLRRHDGSELPVMKSVRRISIDGQEKLLETFVDMSERKRMKTARRESEDRYRVLFESSREAMMVLAPPAWNFISANAATLALFGVKDLATFVTLSPSDLSPATQPDGRASDQRVREMIEVALREGSHAFEWRHRSLDGREIAASVQLTRLTFAGQTLVQATVRDLTSAELALSALRNSEERLRLAVEATGMGTYLWDHATGAATYSPEFLALYDLPPNGTLALGPDMVPLAVLDEDRSIFQAAMTAGNDPRGDGVTKVDYRIRRPDGSTRWLMAKGRTEFEGSPDSRRPSRSAGITMDITGRKRTDELAAVRLRLQEFAVGHTLEELLRNTVDEAETLTASLVGFYHFVEPDQLTLTLQAWSNRTVEKFCKAEGRNRHYSVDQAGVWVDCIREQRPIIHNDYASLPGKKGLPEGHAPVIRELVVPIFRNSRIVAVLGVGNKANDYTEADISALTYLADVAWEIAQRKLAEVALRESEEQLDKIFNSTSNCMAITEPASMKILKVNNTWVGETGITRADAVGKTALAMGLWHSPKERAASLALLERDGRLREFEATLSLQGVPRRFAINAEYVDMRAGRFLLWEFRDITERRRAEAEIALLKHSIDVHSDAAYWFDSEGKFVYVNEAGYRALGFEQGELIGKPILVANPGATPERMRVVWDTLRTKGAFRNESSHCRRDGSEFPVEILTTYVQYDGKEYACGFARDISERKAAEAERATLQEQLAQAQKMESVGRLAGGVAHDFNNMLGVILGQTELALEKVDPSQSLYGDLQSIRSAGERSAELTRQLLAFARKQTVAPKVLDLNDTVAGMLKMVRRLIGEDVELVWRPGQNLWSVRIDPSQIDQILANLCVNARDAISNVGGITIETGIKVIGADDSRVSPDAVPGSYVWLTVRDDGCGMDPSVQAHVFEPFFTTKEVGKGTGLGLATVYGIVKQNKGFIELHSERGKGTVFTIYLPRHSGKDANARADAVTGELAPGRETILLVEDEALLLEVTQRILEKRGYKVLAAGTPGQALQLARDHAGAIDLLITDVVMPEMNGRDLAKNFLSLYPLAKRLFMSGYTADVIAHQGVLEDGVYFIQKPFPARELAAMVHKLLDTVRDAR